MIRSVFWNSLGVVCLILGLAGLLLPFVPGVLLLAGAAVCFRAASPGSRARRSPTLRNVRVGWHSAGQLRWLDRCRLAFWTSAQRLVAPLTSDPATGKATARGRVRPR